LTIINKWPIIIHKEISMDSSRKALFDQIKSRVGNTPLYEIKNIQIPNGNRIFAKEEYLNALTGSHYDRVYVSLLEDLEKKGEIAPDKVRLIETTSGNAGTSFAATAKLLGYTASVIIPENVSDTRINSIECHGANVIKTPKEKFIQGVQRKLKEILIESRKSLKPNELPFYCPDHSRQKTSIDAISVMAQEVLDQTSMQFDIFVAAIGNGLSILGPSKILKYNGLKIIGWDPLQAPRGFEMKFPGRYKELFGIDPGSLGLHKILGTGVLGVKFPFLDEVIFGSPNGEPIIDDIMIAADEEAIHKLSVLINQNKIKANILPKALNLPNITQAHFQLVGTEYKSVGYSSAGSFATALKLCESHKDKKLLIIFYDSLANYIN